MTRQTVTSEFNSFVGGLITEASPLTFPGNAALEINNFNIDKRGTISRRLGMDYEQNHVIVNSGGVGGVSTGDVATRTFVWDNVGGDASLKFVVVRVGDTLDFFQTSGDSVSSGLVYSYTLGSTPNSGDVDASVVDGLFVLVGEAIDPTVFSYESGVITPTTFRLKIRDTFGVEAVIGGVDYRESGNLTERPFDSPTGTIDAQSHLYNLRNSTWALPKMSKGGGTSAKDPIVIFSAEANQAPVLTEVLYPSTSDSPVPFMFPDPDDSSDRVSDRFHPIPSVNNPIGSQPAPSGFFIIDALNRGTSRLEGAQKLNTQYELGVGSGYESDFPITTLPLDRTPSSAKATASFAGRVWYAGFSGEVVDGDRHSPRMSSYILFSTLVQSPADLGNCYQIGDPTSVEESQLVATDGGFVKLDEAYNINRLVNIGTGIVVVAENGVWFISGGSDLGFTATEYKVTKVTGHGCTASNSVVLVDNSVVYWGDDGIYQIAVNELGDLHANNLSTSTIQAVFNGISEVRKRFVKGRFDSYDRKIRWLYNNLPIPIEETKELVLDVELGSFYKHSIPTASATAPNVVDYIEVPPFKLAEVIEGVVDGGVQVVDSGVPVETTLIEAVDGQRELLYLTILDIQPTTTYTMSKYSDTDFIDWKTFDSVGIDAPATMITGYNGGGDFQRYKQVPYVSFHFEKTEDGFFTDGLGDIYPTHESSCKVQAQWEWANSATSGRWGKEFQAYRQKRAYIPEDTNDLYDNGFSVVTTKSKLRGKGKVLSLQINTEPLKDCRILGWSTITSVANNV